MEPKYPCQRALYVGTNYGSMGVSDPLARRQMDVICGALKYGRPRQAIFGFFMLDPYDGAEDFMCNLLCDSFCPHREEADKKPVPEGWSVTSDLELRRKK